MYLKVEAVIHSEGILEQHVAGFADKSKVNLVRHGSPLEIIQKLPATRIFTNY
jgi:hypothetical protein